MANIITDYEYTKMINKYFNKIGKEYSKSINMLFIANGKKEEIEEQMNTFSSMNFVYKILEKLPSSKYVLMNKEQAIRFIRVIEQRVLKLLKHNNIFFYSDKLTQIERDIDIRSAKVLKKLISVIDKLAYDNYIINDDIYKDNPEILQSYINESLSKSALGTSINGFKYKQFNIFHHSNHNHLGKFLPFYNKNAYNRYFTKLNLKKINNNIALKLNTEYNDKLKKIENNKLEQQIKTLEHFRKTKKKYNKYPGTISQLEQKLNEMNNYNSRPLQVRKRQSIRSQINQLRSKSESLKESSLGTSLNGPPTL